MFGSVTPAFGADATVTSFAIVVLGSLGNPLGTALGGVVYGVCYMLVQTYLSSWADLLPYVLLIFILLLRPSGCSEGGCALPSAFKHTLFIVVPLVAVFAVLPGVYQNHLLLFNFVIFLILAQGVNIIYGFTGYLPFGYVGFFGAGAYGFAILVMHYQAARGARGAGRRPGRRSAGAVADAAVASVRRLFRHRQSRGVARGASLRRQSGARRTSRAGPTASRSPERSIRRWPMPPRSWCWPLTLGAVVFLKNSRFGLALQAVREDAVQPRWRASTWCGCA